MKWGNEGNGFVGMGEGWYFEEFGRGSCGVVSYAKMGAEREREIDLVVD